MKNNKCSLFRPILCRLELVGFSSVIRVSRVRLKVSVGADHVLGFESIHTACRVMSAQLLSIHMARRATHG